MIQKELKDRVVLGSLFVETTSCIIIIIIIIGVLGGSVMRQYLVMRANMHLKE